MRRKIVIPDVTMDPQRRLQRSAERAEALGLTVLPGKKRAPFARIFRKRRSIQMQIEATSPGKFVLPDGYEIMEWPTCDESPRRDVASYNPDEFVDPLGDAKQPPHIRRAVEARFRALGLEAIDGGKARAPYEPIPDRQRRIAELKNRTAALDAAMALIEEVFGDTATASRKVLEPSCDCLHGACECLDSGELLTTHSSTKAWEEAGFRVFTPGARAQDHTI